MDVPAMGTGQNKVAVIPEPGQVSKPGAVLQSRLTTREESLFTLSLERHLGQWFSSSWEWGRFIPLPFCVTFQFHSYQLCLGLTF